MKSFRIGSLFGIPIKLDLTFLLVLPFFAYLIGVQIVPVVGVLNEFMDAGISSDAIASGSTPWILGTVAAVGLFVGVVFHELGHSLTAQRYGFPIESITLWLLGGLAALSEMPEDWKQELNIAIAGPIVSILVGVAAYGLFLVTPTALEGIASQAVIDGTLFVLGYLAILNVGLAIFNMVPAFPMDGGRVLRALLARNRPYAKATQQAASVGKLFAVVMAIFGLFSNFFLIFVALFVYIAASTESRQVTMKAAFEGVAVSDIMTPARSLHTVAPETSIATLIQRMFSERHTGYPVLDDGYLVGLVTLSDARDVKPVERDAFTVSDVMSTELKTIEPHADAMTALERMQQDNIGRLLVIDGHGDLVGLITRTDLMTAMNIIRESGAVSGAGEARPAN
ncbi:CBS domain-containing protein [Natronosalvus vescus]|uniref:CBS domain-containing protein n=1 Tax=Natronosalvus vescus TaxID=2953881 RepID=UPI002091C470|nr:CBS domain-containing protein [Natronosalvus vescus]